LWGYLKKRGWLLRPAPFYFSISSKWKTVEKRLLTVKESSEELRISALCGFRDEIYLYVFNKYCKNGGKK